MRPVLGQIAMDGVVVIGEGEKDNAPMLYNGERVGSGSPPQVDIAVDPVDGTTLTAKSLPNAIAVVALAERGTMFDPGPCVYMEKLAVGRPFADVVDFEALIEDNLRRIAAAKDSDVTELTVCILDRPRHEEELVGRVRATGARIKFLLDGDVAGAIMAAREETGIDLAVGIGGTPEGVITACALKCLGRAMYGRLWPRNDDERRAALDAGYDLDKVLTIDDMVRGDNVFFAATGVTDGELLRGVRFRPNEVLNPVPVDALGVGCGPPDRGPPPARPLEPGHPPPFLGRFGYRRGLPPAPVAEHSFYERVPPPADEPSGRRPGPLLRPAPRLRGTRLPGPAVDLQPGQPLLHPRRLGPRAPHLAPAAGVADRRRSPRPPLVASIPVRAASSIGRAVPL